MFFLQECNFVTGLSNLRVHMKNKTNISWQGFTRYPSVLALMLWFGQANAIEITDIYDTDFCLNIDNHILEYRHELADDLLTARVCSATCGQPSGPGGDG